MGGWSVRVIGCGLAAVLSAVVLTGTAAASEDSGDVVTIPVSFQVSNVNQSRVACASDGRRYTVRGNIVAPRSVLSSGDPALTIYSHGLAYTGESFYHFTAVPGYDYVTEQARKGHASLEFDLPGYGDSDAPRDGHQICYGSEATIIHQMIGQLRSGHYDADGEEPVAFHRIALAGHSASGFTVQAEAYSFHDIDALIVMSFADQGFSPLLLQTTAATTLRCTLGGDPKPGRPGTTGYAYFGQTDADYRAGHLHNTDPEVAEVATAHRVKDPCGRIGSAIPNAVSDIALLATVHVPVLLVYGQNDALFQDNPVGTPLQKAHYLGSNDVTDIFLPNTGHALTLERTAPQMRERVSDWLRRHGL
ncbi:MAG TPA: alpha/beta hydrolase [Pseudonocardia sp.]|uniref:alpha/beta hydrolase n=1 Tax=Pseudonocardia sp. TaxID=60912 RepID=UPI002CB5E8A8|nr:alpha/beta hydrolase [Pseudonocardia sp.]HTF54753.1 alpha/beta hydrolase [Pseudonocardia sp.]